MTKRILRITYESTFGTPRETAKKYIDVIESKNGEYHYKFTSTNIEFNRISVKKKVDVSKVRVMLEKLAEINVPAFPQHQMGCDGGFTEIEVGGYSGKSLFRWWSCPPKGWEELDDITQKLIADADFENDGEQCRLAKEHA